MTRQHKYPDIVRQRIAAAWERHKQETKATQAKAAKALGMGQSGFSQYIRGDIPLNTDFLIKFAMFVGQTPSDFDENFETRTENKALQVTIPLVGALGSAEATGALVVEAYNARNGVVGVLVDIEGFPFPKGSVILCESDTRPMHGEQAVALREGQPAVYGSYTESGSLTVMTAMGVANIPVADCTALMRASGLHFPSR